jgi:ribA/ribD-fused uncharacterized protein
MLSRSERTLRREVAEDSILYNFGIGLGSPESPLKKIVSAPNLVRFFLASQDSRYKVLRGVDMEKEPEVGLIDRFSGPYLFLSNFYPCCLKYQDRIWLTVEHAYQASKTLNSKEQEEIRLASSPWIAKKLGKKVTIRQGWDLMKLNTMRSLVELKFKQNERLTLLLLSTRSKTLVEGNYWHDSYWGVDLVTGIGENWLGKILMEVRGTLKADSIYWSREKGFPIKPILKEDRR